MPLDLPNLDDRTAENIKAELLLRIPRYLPNEWTDWNESDPGVILIELFSWLAESLAYRMNQAPERCLRTFLDVLGISPKPARPASADLTFVPRRGQNRPIPIPKFTRIASDVRAEDGPITFETTEGLDLILLPLASIQVGGSSGTFDTISPDGSTYAPFRPFGYDPQIGNALYLGFEPVDGADFPQQISLLVDPSGTTANGRTAPDPFGVLLRWEYRDTIGGRWKPLNLFEDGSRALSRRGYIRFGGPGPLSPPQPYGKDVRPLHWIRCRLDGGTYEAGFEPVLDLLRLNTVTARSLTTVKDEYLGDSDATTGQTFKLRHRNVVTLGFQLTVTEPDGRIETWRLVEDLAASQPLAADFMLDPANGTTTFGDGTNGRIPTAGAELVATYRYGGAALANVPKDSLTALLSSVVGVDSVTNKRAAVGGADAETNDQLRRRAPSSLRTRERALTVEDYRLLATAVGGVADASAIALMHPDYLGVAIPGCVTVALIANTTRRIPTPSAELIDAVTAALEPKRPIGTELFVRPARFVEVAVDVIVEVDPYAAFDQVTAAVLARIDERLSPISGNRHESAFGADFYPTSLYGAIQDLPDVRAVPSLVIRVDGVTSSDLALPVIVARDQIIVPADHHNVLVKPSKDQ